MTHDELLAKINKNALISARLFGWVVNRKESNALRAVVELHKPFQVNDILLCECEPIAYPCPTIQVIEKELS